MSIFSSVQKYFAFLMSQESIKTLIDHGSLQVSHNCIFFFHFYQQEVSSMDTIY